MSDTDKFLIRIFWLDKDLTYWSVDVCRDDTTEDVMRKIEDLYRTKLDDLLKCQVFVLRKPIEFISGKEFHAAVEAMGGLAGDNFMPWEGELVSEVFPAGILGDKHTVQVILKSDDEAEDQLHDLPSVASNPGVYLSRNPPKSPSSEAVLSSFTPRQANDIKAIFCGRPANRVKVLPPTLLNPDLAQFVTDLKTCKPRTEDINCFYHLCYNMSALFLQGKERMTVFRSILKENGFGDLKVLNFDYYITDGGMQVFVEPIRRDFTSLIIEGKNEIGHGGADPMIQDSLCYIEAVRSVMNRLSEEQCRRTNFPVVLLQHYGPHISVAVGVFGTAPNVQILSPIIPLHFHPTDTDARATGERFICALRQVLERLEKYYKNVFLKDSPFELDPRYPFRNSYTDETGVLRTFEYEGQLPDKRSFFAQLKGTPQDKLFVKFTKRYSEEVHRAACGMGLAPRLQSVERYEDGWIMVVMDNVFQEYGDLEDIFDSLSAEERTTLYDIAVNALRKLHDHPDGHFVHGDIRASNIMVKRRLVNKKVKLDEKPQIMFVDFDWAGRADEVVYPSTINMELYRPQGVERGGPVSVEHDVEMLDFVFRKLIMH